MKRFLTILAAATVALTLNSESRAYLGGFEQADGYLFDIAGNPPLYNWIDVADYDAGQSGANAGGGSPTPIALSSGLWKVNSQAGSFYPTIAQRNANLSSAPPYPNPSST